jgi:pimeloyl-ACP methyl ester carboxylesterase
MPVEVIMPKVDMDMTHGTLAAWHVREGDEIRQGSPLFDIETDKAAMEVEAPSTGRIVGISAQPGDRVPVGTVVAMIYAAGEAAIAPGPSQPVRTAALPAELEPARAPALPPGPAAIQPIGAAAEAPLALPSKSTEAVRPGAVRATPAARALARDQGVRLDDLSGSGPRGRIQRGDVVDRIEAKALLVRPDKPATASWTPGTGPLHVSRRDGRGAPLVLVHGFAADGQSWAPFEKALGADRPLIRIDLPGHGRSPRRRITDFRDLAKLVVSAFDDATRGLGPVHLLGHSLGGALSLSIADLRAPRLASLALIAPAGLGPEIDGPSLQGIARASRAESLGPWLRRLTATVEGIGDDYVRAAMRQRSDPELRAYQHEMTDALFPDGTQSFDLRPALARLDLPTAIIWGRKDRILPYRHAFAAEGEVAIHLLREAGHVPHIECPERVGGILRRHWAAAEAST